MIIRPEKAGDVEGISRLQYAAFKDHPQHPPGAEPTEHIIVEGLRAAGALALSLVAEEDGILAGHIALSPAAVGESAAGWFLLGPVGVLPPMQGRGIGSALVRAAMEDMRSRGALGIVLVGDPAFYGRFGFGSSEGLTYAGVPPQYVLAAVLGGVPPCGGICA